MSFDDVAKRMKERHGDSMGSLYGDGSQPPLQNAVQSSLPDPNQYAYEMAQRERSSRRTGNIVFGLILFLVGLFITLGTYDSASQSGGTYIIAYGPMIVGIIRIFKGLAS